MSDDRSYQNALDQLIQEMDRYPEMSREEEVQVARRYRAGDERAGEELVLRNLRFIIHLAKRHLRDGVELSDLIQAGILGAFRAAPNYDPEYDNRFVSYAIRWIRQEMSAASRASRNVYRLPTNRETELSKVYQTQSRIEQQTGRRPSPEEVAKELGQPAHLVRQLLASRIPSISLDQTEGPDGEEGGSPLRDRMVGADPDDGMVSRDRYTLLSKAMREVLPARDEQILRLVFGLDGSEEHTLEEVGAIYGVTRERIRQIRDRALRKLQESDYAEPLSEIF